MGKIKRNQPRNQGENCGAPYVRFIFVWIFQMFEGATFISLNIFSIGINTMGMHSHHATQEEGGRLCVPDECVLVWNVQNQTQNKTLKTLWRCRLKLVRKCHPSSTMKLGLHWHGLKGYSARKKTVLQKKHKHARLQVTNSHWDKDLNFWRPGLCGLMKLK